MPSGKTPGAAELWAAGAVLWRPSAGGPQAALVHRPRYDDWSLPKGKRLPGEHPLLTAVREVAEETGVQVVLGRRLPSIQYLRNGRVKCVDYWAATAAPGPHPGFFPNEEVDQLDWLPLAAARSRLSYPRDVLVLDEFAAGAAATTPLILARHASAGSKKAWRAAGHASDLPRPLDADGRGQAAELGPLLCCFARGRILSSVAERCVATVRPYSALAGLQVETAPALTVHDNAQPEAGQLVTETLGCGLPAVICAHRENLPDLLGAACATLGATVPDGPPLRLASCWVLHIAKGSLVAAERVSADQS